MQQACVLRSFSMMTWAPWAWDPMAGCTTVSEGCRNCVARTQMINLGYAVWKRTDFKPTLLPREFHKPLEEPIPRRVIVAPQSDFFHEDFPIPTLWELLDVMRAAPQHTFYIPTKRHERMHQCLSSYKHWPLPNVNIVLTTENQKRLDERLPFLLDLPIHEEAECVLSCEPLLSPIQLGPRRQKIDWLIHGSERGPSKRPSDPSWHAALVKECRSVGIPTYHHGSAVSSDKLLPGEAIPPPAPEWSFPRACVSGRLRIEPQDISHLKEQFCSGRHMAEKIGVAHSCLNKLLRGRQPKPRTRRQVEQWLEMRFGRPCELYLP